MCPVMAWRRLDHELGLPGEQEGRDKGCAGLRRGHWAQVPHPRSSELGGPHIHTQAFFSGLPPAGHWAPADSSVPQKVAEGLQGRVKGGLGCEGGRRRGENGAAPGLPRTGVREVLGLRSSHIPASEFVPPLWYSHLETL